MENPKAVFISYAREDLAAARRIADALAAFDVEVWVDQTELQGGDAWDREIRAQIKNCALFVPIISANTEARREAYFRLEWKLAEERTHLMAEGTSFLVPIAIDTTMEDGALVPASFLRAQWLRLPRGVPNTHFVDRVRTLLEDHPRSPGQPAAPPRPPERPWIGKWTGLVAGLALAGGLWFLGHRAGPAAAGEASAVANRPEKSIAVLPFVNMGEAPENAFFTDGIHEDILTTLANVGELKVISRTSVAQYRDSQKPLRQIAEELGVRYVLEGSVQRAGNSVRVTAQLIDARTDAHIWAQKYDEQFDLNDVFAIQSALATEIAGALNAAISPQEKARLGSRPTTNVAAYEFYLRGREQFRAEDNTRDRLAKTEPLFAQAVALDSGFALAWKALADVHFLAYQTLDRSAAQLAQAKECVDTAVRLAPDDPVVILGLGNYYEVTNDLKAARACYERAVAAAPNNVDVLASLSSIDRKDGHWEAALAELRQAASLDPRSRAAQGRLDALLLSLRRFTELEQRQKLWADLGGRDGLLERYNAALLPFDATGSKAEAAALVASLSPLARKTEPNAIIINALWSFTIGDAPGLIREWQDAGPNWRFSPILDRFDLLSVAMAYLKLGQKENARPLLEKNRALLVDQLAVQPENTVMQSDLALTNALLGNREIARAQIARLDVPGIDGDQQEDLAMTYAWLGDRKRALELLAAALGRPTPPYGMAHGLEAAINWWPLQGDPGFEAIVNDPKNNAPLL